MNADYRLVAFVHFLLFLTTIILAIHMQGRLGYSFGVVLLYTIASSSFFLSIFSIRNLFIKFNTYSIMFLGSLFTFDIYIIGGSEAIGSVWLIHTLIFAYYFLGRNMAFIWNNVYIFLFVLLNIYLYFHPEDLAYSIPMVVSLIGSMLVGFTSLMLYSYHVDRIQKERDDKSRALENAMIDLKSSQEKLIESEKMSSLGRLVAGIAHEINTPLGNSITGVTNIEYITKDIIVKFENSNLSKSVLDTYFMTTQESAQAIHLSLATAAKLVQSFKQIAVDQHVEEKRVFNLKSHIDEILLSVQTQLKYSHVDVVNTIDSAISINSYAGVYYQLVNNFINNSLLHAFEGQADGARIEIDAYFKNEFLIFSYTDNGSGMSSEVKAKVFDPFFTTKMGEGGSGLGMSIIYTLVTQKLHGSIVCKSVQNQGTTFTLEIPENELS